MRWLAPTALILLAAGAIVFLVVDTSSESEQDSTSEVATPTPGETTTPTESLPGPQDPPGARNHPHGKTAGDSSSSAHKTRPRPIDRRDDDHPNGVREDPRRAKTSSAPRPRPGTTPSTARRTPRRTTKRPPSGADAPKEAPRGGKGVPAEATPQEAPTTLQGVVRDDHGQPVPRVVVRALRSGDAGPRRAAMGRTDARGVFSLAVPPGTWWVEARGAGRVQSELVEISAGETIQVRLPPLAEPTWHVRLLDGGRAVELPRALVRLRLAKRVLSGRARKGLVPLVMPAGTDPPREATLTIEPGDDRYRAWSGRVVLPPKGQTLDVTLSRTPTLALTCLLKGDHTSAAVEVLALPSEGLLLRRAGVGLVVQEDGSFEEEILRSTGTVKVLDDGSREVKVHLGVDVSLPAALRVVVTPQRPYRKGDPTPDPMSLEVTLADPLTEARVDLR